ncbi:hypothetical protein EYF80_039536 [Liparis tanakae]|uniref:Uncharacterized protein n=1 Tax=Liparis tanakae TaxID=230148 RepID=A0A4Z2GAL1_9TELE|nr:hypothetical protein EYF80_039536 [Liparis tanakae]
MEGKLWILEDLNMMYIRQIALSLQTRDTTCRRRISTGWCSRPHRLISDRLIELDSSEVDPFTQINKAFSFYLKRFA